MRTASIPEREAFTRVVSPSPWRMSHQTCEGYSDVEPRRPPPRQFPTTGLRCAPGYRRRVRGQKGESVIHSRRGPPRPAWETLAIQVSQAPPRALCRGTASGDDGWRLVRRRARTAASMGKAAEDHHGRPQPSRRRRRKRFACVLAGGEPGSKRCKWTAPKTTAAA